VSSAAPGQAGNTVIYGHNNILGAIFRNLSSLQAGNEITVINGVASWRYAVERADIFQVAGTSADEQLAQTAFFAFTPDERLTLLSCYPFTNNTHRIAVVAKPAP
jgi:sortase A